MKLKVLLVGINSKFVHSNLALRYLKAYTEDLDYECILKEYSINDRLEKILEGIMKANANVVAFSCYIWNIDMIKALAKLIKLINDNIEIIYGGPEVTHNGKEYLKKQVGEYLIEGEGEDTFRKLIENKIMLNEQTIESIDLSKIKGLFYKQDGNIFYGGKKDNINFNSVVFPYKEEDELENKIIYYEASRGCPYGCKYCLSSVDRNVRVRDIEKVKEELKFLIEKKVSLIKFVDRTFNCNEQFAIDIWDFIIQQDIKTKFHFEISANILTDNQIKILKRAPKGRLQFEVGVQTTNSEVLRNIDRYVKFEDISEKVIKIKELGNISQHLDLIAGLPGENYESFKNSFNEVYELKPEELQLGFLKILKGSPIMYEKEQWGIEYSPYSPYEVIKTKDISYEQLILLKKVEAMVDKYYNSGKFSTIIQYFELKFENNFDMYLNLGIFFDEKGYFDRNISGIDYYKVFLEFNSEKLKEDNKVLKEIIKYDYLMYNKKKWLPEFLNRDIDIKLTREIKEKFIKSKLEILKNNTHVEKYNIDILNFIKTNKILDKDVYLLYGENNLEVMDISGHMLENA